MGGGRISCSKNVALARCSLLGGGGGGGRGGGGGLNRGAIKGVRY